MNNLQLDHVFILTGVNAPAADRLIELGFQESAGRVHAGQGTANRRFELANGMLEFLWVCNASEAINGAGSGLQFAARAEEKTASPFGLIVTADDTPFDGWCYQPDYFPPPMAFHVGENSSVLQEPLCVRSPVASRERQKDDPRKVLSQLKVTVPVKRFSQVLLTLQSIDQLEICPGTEHLMEITFVGEGRRVDLRPELPLVITL